MSVAEDKVQAATLELAEGRYPDLVAGDMREFIELLKQEDELVVVSEPVDPRNFELSSIVQHMENGPNKAVLFENVKGFDIPVVTVSAGEPR